MKRLIMPVAVLALALAACAGCSKDDGPDGKSGQAASAPASGDHNEQDVIFAQELVPHHEQAVEMATLAESRAANPEVKKLAAKIKGVRGPEIATMSGWLKGWKAEPARDQEASDDTGGDGMMSTGELEELGTVKGADFDRLFLELMVKHHQGGVAMAQDEIAQGSFAPAKTLARSVVDAQTTEIATMESLLKS